MFQDELVIRSSSGFELTLRGRKILQELEQLLPKIEGLVVASVFDPKRERSNFRISGPDNVCMALLPLSFAKILHIENSIPCHNGCTI
jgi:DNA-binding transcriptional LysR family regulator